jgi:hydroxymethylpyrimidine pyrophosphatase-like HAD family hydrolase/MoaA/NifB/PqqE/SkfB family radical SAM enzyme
MLEGVKNICFRGFLSSCNYSCSYCSFAKSRLCETELMKDKECLNRFCNFIDSTEFRNEISVFLTPYGEGLIHQYYIDTIVRLALNPKCRVISCQTNLSFNADAFIRSLKASKVDLSKIKLWASCHPEMVSIDEFVNKVNQLKASIDLCTGIVAIPEDLQNVFELRKRLPKDIYMWINAKEREKTKYSHSQVKSLIQADPLFSRELQKYRVQNSCCHAGNDSVFIRANGDVFPCHMNKKRLFNIYTDSGPVPPFQCNRRFCDCYLAYSHRFNSNLGRYFGDYVPVRVPHKKEIQALFLDVDGTITDKSGKVSEMAVEHLGFLKDTARVYLATSLPLHIAMKKCNRIKSFISGGVFANGGQIVDFDLNYRQTISFGKEALEAVSDIPQVRVYKENDLVYKALAFSKLIPPHLKLDPRLKLTYERDLVSINSNDAGKLEGILKICRINGFCEDKVFVLGNSLNDLEAIRYFKNSAATIASKCSALKEQAGYILNIEHLAMFVKGTTAFRHS